LLTTSFQSRTQGVLQIRFLGEDLPEGVEADDSLQATLVVPESLTLGLRLGPVENTAFHAEYHTRFWSRATLGDHPLGTIFPGMEAGLTQQRNEARLALGLSHRLTLKGMLSCLLAAGLSWNQPLFVGDDGEPRIIRSQHLGAKLQIGNHLALAAAIRLSRGSWPRAGVYDPEEEFTYSMTRSTLMLGVDFYPEGLK
jgi:hypothetical protein